MNAQLMTFKSSVILLLLFLSTSMTTYGQREITMDQFLLKSNESASNKLQNDKIKLLSDGKWNLPLIERVEFRTETKNFELSKQEYTLRINTNSFKKIQSHNNLVETEMAINKLHQSVLYQSEMMNRYLIILSYVFTKERLAIVTQQNSLLIDKLAILKKMAQWDQIKINELIDTEDKLLRTEIEKLSLENSITSLNNTISHLCNETVILNTDDLLAARFIREHYEEILITDTITSKEMKKIQLEIMKNDEKLIEKRAEKRKFIKYYQMKYNANDSEFEQNQFSLGIGFLIPVGTTDRLDKAQMKLDELELQSDLATEMDEIKVNQFIILNKLRNSISAYEVLSKHQENSLASKTLKKYLAYPEISALSLISLKAHEIKYKERILESDFQLYKDYIKSLEEFNLISAKPFQNFLSFNHFGY